jgi:murein DD-endopeptidase MepM/ murein hydrolase activator NlpD
MKYIFTFLFVLLLILIFYPNDYVEIDTTIYVENNRHYNIYNRYNVHTDPNTTAVINVSRSGGVHTGEWIMPLRNDEGMIITSLIGYRMLRGGPAKYHRGFDFSNGKSGSDILSIGDGVVVDIKPNPNNSSGFGICLTVRYYSSDIENFCVIYAHLESYDESLVNGSAVTKGQVIGKVGNTGESTGAHLHWQLFYGVKYSDLTNSFNPFQVLYPVENSAKAIEEAFGIPFRSPENLTSERAFYAAHAANPQRYAEHYRENQQLGMLLDDFFR